jgi:hypothetical protein
MKRKISPTSWNSLPTGSRFVLTLFFSFTLFAHYSMSTL